MAITQTQTRGASLAGSRYTLLAGPRNAPARRPFVVRAAAGEPPQQNPRDHGAAGARVRGELITSLLLCCIRRVGGLGGAAVAGNHAEILGAVCQAVRAPACRRRARPARSPPAPRSRRRRHPTRADRAPSSAWTSRSRRWSSRWAASHLRPPAPCCPRARRRRLTRSAPLRRRGWPSTRTSWARRSAPAATTTTRRRRRRRGSGTARACPCASAR